MADEEVQWRFGAEKGVQLGEGVLERVLWVWRVGDYGEGGEVILSLFVLFGLELKWEGEE